MKSTSQIFLLLAMVFSRVDAGLTLNAFAVGHPPGEPQTRGPARGAATNTPPVDEARRQAQAFWTVRAVTCNGITYVGYGGLEVHAIRGFAINVQPKTLTEADRLNGLQWQGTFTITGTASRTFLTTTLWQPWQNGLGFGDFTVNMTQRNGSWSMGPSRYSAIDKVQKISCADIPPDVIAPGSVWYQKLVGVAGAENCTKFMGPDGYYRVDTAIRWLQGEAPIDLKTCRGENGRTPLMRVALHAEPEVTQLFLDRGADPYVRDNSGLTALDLVEAENNEKRRRNGNPDAVLSAVSQILRTFQSKNPPK